MNPATSIGRRQTRRYMPSSMISYVLSARISMDAKYQTMAVWETPDVIPGRTPAILDFARIWQAADKIVYSKSLETVSTRKTRIEREFDPQVVRGLKSQLHHDVAVGGPTLAAHAIRAGLVDEYHLFVAPVIIGGGKPVLPGNVRVTLELLDERGFDKGMVYLRYPAITTCW